MSLVSCHRSSSIYTGILVMLLWRSTLLLRPQFLGVRLGLFKCFPPLWRERERERAYDTYLLCRHFSHTHTDKELGCLLTTTLLYNQYWLTYVLLAAYLFSLMNDLGPTEISGSYMYSYMCSSAIILSIVQLFHDFLKMKTKPLPI